MPNPFAPAAPQAAPAPSGGGGSAFLSALPYLLAGPGAFASALGGYSRHNEAMAAQQVRGGALSRFMDQAMRSGNPVQAWKTLTPDEVSALASDPDWPTDFKNIMDSMRQGSEPLVTGPGDIIRDPNSLEILAENPVAPPSPTAFMQDSEYLLGTNSSAEERMSLYRYLHAKQSTTNTVNLPPLENEFMKGVGKNDSEIVAQIRQRASDASIMAPQYDIIEQAVNSGNFTPGFLGSQRMLLGQAASLFGIDAQGLSELIGDPKTAEAMDAATNKLAVVMAQNSERLKMAMEFNIKSLPSLLKTPEGVQTIIAGARRAQRRANQEAELADRYIREFGTLRPKGIQSFDAALRELDISDPVVDENLKKQVASAREKGKGVKTSDAPQALGSPPPSALAAPVSPISPVSPTITGQVPQTFSTAPVAAPSLPPPEQRVVGKEYTNSTGHKAIWTGSGWQGVP